MERTHLGLLGALGALTVVGLSWSAGCSSDPDETGTGGGTSTTSTTTSTTTPSSSGTGGEGGQQLCEPADMTGFTHDWKPSLGLYQGECSAAQIDELFVACLEASSTQAACDTFTNSNEDCLLCAISTPDQDYQSPITLWEQYDGLADGNMGPCVAAFEGDDSSASCGAKIDAETQCTRDACLENCADATISELLTCIDAATQGDCTTYADAADTCSSTLLGLGNPIDACIWDEAGSESWFVYGRRIVTAHCGDDPGAGGSGGSGGSGGAGGSGT